MVDEISRARQLRNMLGTPARAALESTGLVPALSRPREAAAHVEGQLNDIIARYLGDQPELHYLARELAAKSEEGAALFAQGDDARFDGRADLLAGLEAIVVTDGTRPSFLVRQAKVDLASSPAGDWKEVIGNSGELLDTALRAVGRIDHPASAQQFEGTGFLVARDVIVTNRHVLQQVADPAPGGGWSFHQGTRIDFGHEYQGSDSVGARALRSVLFCGAAHIDTQSPIDHNHLDLAVIELEPADPGATAPLPLAIEASKGWASPQLATYIVGYPANPGFGYPMSLLEKLFQLTFGYKRLAPGRVITSTDPVAAWTLSHDATTLGGNSGSAVIVAGRETVAAALHYGGKSGAGGSNWGHVLGKTLSAEGSPPGRTLESVLRERGAVFVDRTMN